MNVNRLAIFGLLGADSLSREAIQQQADYERLLVMARALGWSEAGAKALMRVLWHEAVQAAEREKDWRWVHRAFRAAVIAG